MKKFRTGLALIILLAGIFTGLGCSVLHPYVHVLKHDIHHVGNYSDDSHPNFHSSDIAESCYVCMFSKQLALDSFNVYLQPSSLQYELKTESPISVSSAGDDSVIFLRAPPLV